MMNRKELLSIHTGKAAEYLPDQRPTKRERGLFRRMERLSKDRLHTHYVRNEKCCVSAGGNSHRSGNDRQCGRKYAAVRTGRRPLWIFSEEGHHRGV